MNENTDQEFIGMTVGQVNKYRQPAVRTHSGKYLHLWDFDKNAPVCGQAMNSAFFTFIYHGGEEHCPRCGDAAAWAAAEEKAGRALLAIEKRVQTQEAWSREQAQQKRQGAEEFLQLLVTAAQGWGCKAEIEHGRTVIRIPNYGGTAWGDEVELVIGTRNTSIAFHRESLIIGQAPAAYAMERTAKDLKYQGKIIEHFRGNEQEAAAWMAGEK